MRSPLELSYILPLKWSEDVDRGELAGYLRYLSELVQEVIIVDGSDPASFAADQAAWGAFVTHLAVDPGSNFVNGKVSGATTGVKAARFEKVIIADDDVRYEPSVLERMAELLDLGELVRPQNYFDPLPWHSAWDTSRMMVNRALGGDFPSTFGLRRSFFLAMGGYDGDVLFENLELMRTVTANGGRVYAADDLFVARRPPSRDRFFAQRVRQAYDDFAIPPRMAVWLSLMPTIGWSLARGKPAVVGALGASAVGVAAVGRHRAGGRAAFPVWVPLLAPLWLFERAVCAWPALGMRITGGVRYGGGKIVTSANSGRSLARRALRAR
ncbi:MAG: glycosyltransferase family 2 protein [Actinomycetota bacterium]